MFNLGIFTTLVYLSPNILRAQGKLRNLPNMYEVLFSTEPSVTLVYSELKAYSGPSQTSMMKNFIHNIYEIFYPKPCALLHIQSVSIFRTLVYSEINSNSKPCHISKIGHFIKNPV